MILTNKMRTDVIDKAITATFKARDKNLDAALKTLADAMYLHAFGDAERIALKLPRNWLKTSEEVYITCEGFNTRYTLDASKPSRHLKLSKARPIPHVITDEYTLKEGHALFDAAQSIVKEHMSIYAAKEQLNSTLMQLVYSAKTLAKLQEIWPEGAKFFPAEKPRVAAVVPYELTSKVNAMMGLKPKAATK